ncbi:MAG: hypothetical protein ACRC0G_12640 [Fusobacteriaceae bacterium]
MKICFRCGEEKELDAFYKLNRNKDGKDSLCKVCRNISNKKNRDIIISKDSESFRIKAYENLKKWRACNPDKVKELSKAQRSKKKPSGGGE